MVPRGERAAQRVRSSGRIDAAHGLRTGGREGNKAGGGGHGSVVEVSVNTIRSSYGVSTPGGRFWMAGLP